MNSESSEKNSENCVGIISDENTQQIIWDVYSDGALGVCEIQENISYSGKKAQYDKREWRDSKIVPGSPESTRLNGLVYDRLFQRLYRCSEEKEKVFVSRSVTCITEGAFSGCEKLTEVLLPPSLEVIEPGAFQWCKNLKTLNLPDKIQSVPDNAFYQCKQLFLVYRGISFQPEQNKDTSLNAILKMIAEKDFSLEMLPQEKYSILWQMFALQSEEQQITEYIYQNLKETISGLILLNRPELLKAVLECEKFQILVSKENLDSLIRLAIEKQFYEVQLILTDYKNNVMGYDSIEEIIKDKFDL